MTNWQLIATLITLVAAIFGANWLNLQMLKNYIDARFETINVHLTSIEARLDKIERQLEQIFKPVLPGSR
jgi:F0F1-type ATP synthase membrane subunit b/b'